MCKFQKQESPLHNYVVYSDSICDGNTADKDEAGDIVLYTEIEAKAEIKELFELELSNWNKDPDGDPPTLEDFDGYMYEHKDEYIENRKAIFGVGIVGTKPV